MEMIDYGIFILLSALSIKILFLKEINIGGNKPPNGSAIKGKDYKKLYYELIMAVETKYANETRHETALRYIQEREKLESGPCGTEV